MFDVMQEFHEIYKEVDEEEESEDEMETFEEDCARAVYMGKGHQIVEGNAKEIDRRKDEEEHLRTSRNSRMMKPVENDGEGLSLAPLSRIEKWTHKVKKMFAEFFRKWLPSYQSLPLYELLYYEDAAKLKSALSSFPRRAIHLALKKPEIYLGPSLTSPHASVINPLHHDICILYRLYLECGSSINLYDQFTAFGAILERDEAPHTEKEIQYVFSMNDLIISLTLSSHVNPAILENWSHRSKGRALAGRWLNYSLWVMFKQEVVRLIM